MTDAAPTLPTVDREVLTPVVRRILESPAAEVIGWEQRPLGHRALYQQTGGIYRLWGRAQDGDEARSWSVILKVVLCSGDTAAVLVSDRESGTPSYWKREPELFRDGVLDGLGGDFVPPRCFGVDEPDEDTAWIWLEEVVEASGPAWPLARYGLAARHLGQFNARYLVDTQIPRHRSFCPSYIRTELRSARERGQSLPSPEVWDEPAVHAVVTSTDAARFAALWAEQEWFLDVLDHLPQTFCHRDPFRNNLIARRLDDGREQTVALDWALAGPGHLGEDLYKLFSISLGFMRTPSAPREFDAATYEAYLAGLRDVGWMGDARLVRLGFTATVVMGAATGFLMVALRHPESMARLAWILDKPVEALRSRWIEGAFYVLDLADEARDLMTRLNLPIEAYRAAPSYVHK